MGCGASKDDLLSITSTEIVRHPSDLGLEYLELTPSNLVEFDDTFSQAEGTLNQLIELNNDVNDVSVVTAVLQSPARGTGAAPSISP